MIKALILDLNGIFIESEPLSQRFEKDFGIPKEKFHTTLKEVLDTARRQGIEDSFVLWEPYLKSWEKSYNFSLTKSQFFDYWFDGEVVKIDLIEYVLSLRKKGIKVLILSNNFRERTTFYRKNYPNIFTSVDASYFSWETGNVKPDRNAFELVLKEHSLRPRDVLFFDDSEKNVATAKSMEINAHLWPGLKEAREIIYQSFKK